MCQRKSVWEQAKGNPTEYRKLIFESMGYVIPKPKPQEIKDIINNIQKRGKA